MSHLRTKIEYEQPGSYGSTEKRMLYCHHNLSADCVTVYDDKGEVIFSYEEWGKRDFYHQLIKLLTCSTPSSDETGDVQYMDLEDMRKCGL
jgi:hypothetical protein